MVMLVFEAPLEGRQRDADPSAISDEGRHVLLYAVPLEGRQHDSDPTHHVWERKKRKWLSRC
jgi:hypothetical protein